MSNVHSTLTSFLYIQYISKKKNNLKLLITGIYETTWLSIITVALQHTKETIYMYRKVYQIWLLSDLLEVPLPYNPDCCPSTIRPSEHHHDASRRSEIHIDNKRVTKGNINIFLCNSVCFCFICIITSMQHYLKIFSIPCNVECLRLILGFNQQSVEIHLLGGKNKTIGVSNHI